MQEDSQTEDCKRIVSHITGVLEAKTKENAAKKIRRGKKKTTQQLSGPEGQNFPC